MGILLPLRNKEQQMINALRKNDPKAQRQLYELYASKMMAICVRYVGDTMTAEDILVESFLKVFQRIHQFTEEGSLEGWIKRIIINEALGYLRRNKKLSLQLDIDSYANIATNTDDTIATLQADDLMRMINELSVGYRTVFNLYAIEGYSHQEIAAMLSITESTSKSQLHRARTVLQKKLMENTTTRTY